jgi:hypothetical protein
VNRWGRLTDRLELWRDLQRFYTQADLSEVRRVTRDWRNVAEHTADAALANLGYPGSASVPLSGGRVASGEDLALSRAAASLPVFATVIHNATLALLRGAIEHDWSDAWWEEQFA